ncbi:MAG: FecR family protein [Synergistaceae bacterium]|nr:FecR family protein [Synergistaceae bacterium]
MSAIIEQNRQKKQKKAILAAFLSLFFFFVLFRFGQPAYSASFEVDKTATPVRGTIIRLTPSAWVERSGKRFELGVGSAVNDFDILRTGDGASVTVNFLDGTIIELSPNSELSILDVVHSPKASRFSVYITVGGAMITTGSIGLKNEVGVSITTPKGIISANDAVVWVGVSGGEEIVRIEDMTRGPKVSVYNSSTSNILVTTSSRYGIITDESNNMYAVELAPRGN